jgi:hypothetical protein
MIEDWNLFLDDIRDVDYVNDGREYTLARSFHEAQKLILEHENLPAHIAFDHDLGWDTLQPLEGSFLIAAPLEGKELPSGYDFAKWLTELDMDKIIDIPENFSWSIHSSNPVGSANINGILTSYLKQKYNRN